jgi:uncharacterized Tic20 family protein
MSVAIPSVEHVHAPADRLPELTIGSNGRVRQSDLPDGDRTYATLIHLSPMLASLVLGPLAFLGPLVMWVARKEQSVFVDEHGREAINFCLSFLLYHALLAITIFGIVAFPILWLVMIINQIRAAVAAGNSEYFRYPMTIRFLS